MVHPWRPPSCPWKAPPYRATADTYAYDAWGNTVSSSGHLANPLQYAAAVYDPTTSLYDMRARFYDPASGGGHRFLSPDPLGGGYAYVGDSPANFVDPTGMKACAAGGCWYGKTPPAPPKSPSPPPETTTQYIARCGFQDVVFVIGLALSIAGFWFLAPDVSKIAEAITETSWRLDVLGIVSDFKNFMGYIGLLFGFLWYLFTNFLLGMFPWWEQVGETIMLTADVTLPAFVLNLIGAVASGLIGYEGLVSSNCAPQI